METPVKNKPIIHKSLARIIVIDVIQYKGTGAVVVRYATGFGASEKREAITFKSEQEYKENFLDQILERKHETIRNMKTDLLSTAKSNFAEDGNPLKTVALAMFEAMEGIKNKTMTVGQAKCTAVLGQTVINAAKVDIELRKIKK